jgi:hypothetical protein
MELDLGEVFVLDYRGLGARKGSKRRIGILAQLTTTQHAFTHSSLAQMRKLKPLRKQRSKPQVFRGISFDIERDRCRVCRSRRRTVQVAYPRQILGLVKTPYVIRRLDHQGVQEYVAHPHLSENTKNRIFRDYNLLFYHKLLFNSFPLYSTRSLQRCSISIIRAYISSIVILAHSSCKMALSSSISLQVLLRILGLIIFQQALIGLRSGNWGGYMRQRI